MIKAIPTKNTLSNDTDLTWRDRKYKKFYQIVDQLVHEIQEHVWAKTGKPKRRLKRDSLEKLHYSVECLVRDCVTVVYGTKRVGEATIFRGQYHYGANRPDQRLTYKIHVQRAFNALKEMGYVQISAEGFYAREKHQNQENKSQLSRFIARPKLLDLFKESLTVLPVVIPPYRDPEPIKVKSKGHDELGIQRRYSHSFDDTELSDRMFSNLATINKSLSRHWYDLEISNQEMAELAVKRAPKGKPPQPVRFNRRTVHRSFNDTQFETGGRFYGGWWENLPKEYRQFIVINGKRTVELDYSSMHPLLVYVQAGLEMPNDAYCGIISPRKYPKTSYGNDQDPMKDLRKMIKRSLNAMLNSTKLMTRPPRKRKPDDYGPNDFGLTWKEIVNAILEFHHPISDFFFSGIGSRLQRIDSEIAEQTMLHFAKNNIPMLPIHDSFIMHAAYESELREVMNRSFVQVTGFNGKVEIEKKSKRVEIITDDCGLLKDHPDDEWLEEYLSLEHVKRLHAFQAI